MDVSHQLEHGRYLVAIQSTIEIAIMRPNVSCAQRRPGLVAAQRYTPENVMK